MLGNKLPLVSVVVPTYGRADLLSRAIDSVLAQTYENIEVVVVNDNTLNSEQYHLTMLTLQKYVANPKVNIISDGSNVGGALARNKGIELSQGEYISFLDDDDYYYKEKIEMQVKDIINKESDITVCNMHVMKNDVIYNKFHKCKARVKDLSDFLLNGNCYTPMILVNSEKLKDVGMFTESPRFQDHILIIKLLGAGLKISTLNYYGFVHNDNDHTRISNVNKIQEAYRTRYFYEEKYIDLLDSKELKKYWFNRLMDESKFAREKKYFLKSFMFLVRNVKNISQFVDIFRISKSLLVIFVLYLNSRI